jgi:F0F1-type ATP synthase membrane subunit b/b'
MTPDAVRQIADHASLQSDRWLFVAVLLVGGIAFYFAAKWLAGQYQKMLEQWREDMLAMQSQISMLHSDRLKAADDYAAQLREIQREQAASYRDMAKTQADALVRNAEVMGEVRTTLQDLQASCAIARGLAPGGIPFPRRGGDASGGISHGHVAQH